MKGVFARFQNQKKIVKEAVQSVEVQGRGPQEIPKRQEIGDKEAARPTCVENLLISSYFLSQEGELRVLYLFSPLDGILITFPV